MEDVSYQTPMKQSDGRVPIKYIVIIALMLFKSDLADTIDKYLYPQLSSSESIEFQGYILSNFSKQNLMIQITMILGAMTSKR